MNMVLVMVRKENLLNDERIQIACILIFKRNLESQKINYFT